jgi:type II secretory pathway component PulF
VVPKLTQVLIEAGTELPTSTKILIAVSSFMAHYWWLLIIIVVGAGVLLRLFVKTPRGKHMWHTLQLKIPIVGIIYRHIYLVRFTQSMYTLVVGGVPLTKSLGIVANVVGSAVYKDIIERTIKEVEDGNSIATIFAQNSTVPPMLSQMMIVGEKTGRLEEIFKRLSAFYTHEVNNLVSNLVTLLEPAIMLVMGVAVGFIVSSILLPMYRLSGAA